jgi:hypothetical protein
MRPIRNRMPVLYGPAVLEDSITDDLERLQPVSYLKPTKFRRSSIQQIMTRRNAFGGLHPPSELNLSCHILAIEIFPPVNFLGAIA